MKLLIKLVVSIVVLGLLGGGGYLASPWGWDLLEMKKDPVTIAERFWVAALSENRHEADKYRQEQPGLELGIVGFHPNDSVVIGKATQQEYAWFVEANLNLIRQGQRLSIPIQTVVVPVGDEWKVDYWSTKNSIFDASINNAIDWYIATVSGASKAFDDIGGADDTTIKSQVATLDKRLEKEFEAAKEQLVEQYKIALEKKKDKQDRMAEQEMTTAIMSN